MDPVAIGSVWSVPHIQEGIVVLVAGPFGGDDRTPEYLAIPLYPVQTPGFRNTHEDVRIDPTESPFDEAHFAAVWNATPILEGDLEHGLGILADNAVEIIRDVYWSALNGERLGRDPRLGRRPTIWNAKKVREFQESELARWKVFAGRALTSAEEADEALDVLQQYFWHPVRAVYASKAAPQHGSPLLSPELTVEIAQEVRGAWDREIPRAPSEIIGPNHVMLVLGDELHGDTFFVEVRIDRGLGHHVLASGRFSVDHLQTDEYPRAPKYLVIPKAVIQRIGGAVETLA